MLFTFRTDTNAVLDVVSKAACLRAMLLCYGRKRVLVLRSQTNYRDINIFDKLSLKVIWINPKLIPCLLRWPSLAGNCDKV